MLLIIKTFWQFFVIFQLRSYWSYKKIYLSRDAAAARRHVFYIFSQIKEALNFICDAKKIDDPFQFNNNSLIIIWKKSLLKFCKFLSWLYSNSMHKDTWKNPVISSTMNESICKISDWLMYIVVFFWIEKDVLLSAKTGNLPFILLVARVLLREYKDHAFEISIYK